MRPIQEVLHRVRAEFMEMPGLRLTAEQVQRLCGVARKVCQTVLDTLVDEKFLYVNSDGHYARFTSGHHPHLAKAGIRTDQKSIVRTPEHRDAR